MFYTPKSGNEDYIVIEQPNHAPLHASVVPSKCPWCPEKEHRLSRSSGGLVFACGSRYHAALPSDHHPGAGCVEFWKSRYLETADKLNVGRVANAYREVRDNT